MKTVSLAMQSPCDEKWDNFAKTEEGGFCKSCSKVVVDLTKLSDHELLQYLQAQSGPCCGKLRKSQLRTYQITLNRPVKQSQSFVKAMLISGILLLLGKEAIAQQPGENISYQTISDCNDSPSAEATIVTRVSGQVFNESNTPLPGVNVILKGKTTGTTTDGDGKFTFPIDLEPGDILIFSFIGFEQEEYLIRKSNVANVSIKMEMGTVSMLGEISLSSDALYDEANSPLKRFWSKVKQLF